MLVAGGKNPVGDRCAAAVRAGAAAVLVYGAQPPPGRARRPRRPGRRSSPAARGADRDARTIGHGFAVYAAVGRPVSGAEPRARPRRVVLVARPRVRRAARARSSPRRASAIATSDPGPTGDGEPAFTAVTGTSVSAAAVAGAAALLAPGAPRPRPRRTSRACSSATPAPGRRRAERRRRRRSTSARARPPRWPRPRPRSPSGAGAGPARRTDAAAHRAQRLDQAARARVSRSSSPLVTVKPPRLVLRAGPDGEGGA